MDESKSSRQRGKLSLATLIGIAVGIFLVIGVIVITLRDKPQGEKMAAQNALSRVPATDTQQPSAAGTQQLSAADVQRLKPLSCSFTSGDELAYQLKSDSQSTLRLSVLTSALHQARQDADIKDLRQVISTVMHWRVVRKEGASDWLVAGVLTEVQKGTGGAEQAPTSPAFRRDLTEPFLFRIGADCRFQGFGFARSVQQSARSQIQQLLQTAEIMLPVTRSSLTWLGTHFDGIGTYQASYTLHALEPLPRLTKQRLAYTHIRKPSAHANVAVNLVTSAAEIHLQRDGKWVERFRGTEHIQLLIDGQMFTEVQAHLVLTALEGISTQTLRRQWDPDAFVWNTANELPTVVETPPKIPPAPAGFAAKRLPAIMQSFADRLRQGDDQALLSAVTILAQYLRVQPQGAHELIDALQQGEIAADLHSPLFLALELTGTIEAEDALISALRNEELSAINRMRAAVALQDIPNPSESTVDALMSASRHATLADGDNAFSIASTALLALGTLGSRLDGVRPELSGRVDEELKQRLLNSTQVGEKTVVLDAIGNRADPDLLDEVTPLSESADAVVRVHAAQAFRRMATDESEEFLIEWGGDESASQVREAIYETIAGWAQTGAHLPSGEGIETLAVRLANESAPDVRGQLIRILGMAVKTGQSDVARQALAAQFHVEPESSLLVLIGRYVSAADLQ